MVTKLFKYALLLEAEVVSQAARKVQEISETFVKNNTDNDYEESLSNVFDGVEQTIKNFSPQIEKVSESVNKIRSNILDFPKKVI